MKKFFASLLVFSAFSAFAQQDAPLDISACGAQVPFGQPHAVGSSKKNTTVICRRAYMVEHDNIAKIPDWTSYVLTPEHATGCLPRKNAFAADNSLPPQYRSTPKDYADSGYDIGHQVNDGDMSWDQSVQRDSFILSNMAPQLPGFNRGIWKRLEDMTRAYAENRNDPLLVYAGPVYGSKDTTIGNGVVVPHAFYKIIVDLNTHEVLVTEFAHEKAAPKVKLDSFIVDLRKVQTDTNLVFPIPRDAKFSSSMWPSATKSVRKAKESVCTLQ